MITILTIYTLFVTPFVLVFPSIYQWCETTNDGKTETYECKGISDEGMQKNQTLFKIEIACDIIYLIEIILNFFKKGRTEKDVKAIAVNYLSFYFWFDVISTVPCLFMSEPIQFYLLKGFRIVHATRLTHPLQLILGCALQKYSKKR